MSLLICPLFGLSIPTETPSISLSGSLLYPLFGMFEPMLIALPTVLCPRCSIHKGFAHIWKLLRPVFHPTRSRLGNLLLHPSSVDILIDLIYIINIFIILIFLEHTQNYIQIIFYSTFSIFLLGTRFISFCLL